MKLKIMLRRLYSVSSMSDVLSSSSTNSSSEPIGNSNLPIAAENYEHHDNDEKYTKLLCDQSEIQYHYVRPWSSVPTGSFKYPALYNTEHPVIAETCVQTTGTMFGQDRSWMTDGSSSTIQWNSDLSRQYTSCFYRQDPCLLMQPSHTKDQDRLQSDPTSPVQCQWRNCGRMVDHDLDHHVRTVHLSDHSDNSTYVCQWRNCSRQGKPFSARFKLKSHLKTHTHVKSFGCVVCGKTFARKEGLNIHIRCHTGERPYHCVFPGCRKTFSNSSDRHKHVKTHEEKQPYKCKVHGCYKRYTDPSTLRKHMKKHIQASALVTIPGSLKCAAVDTVFYV